MNKLLSKKVLLLLSLSYCLWGALGVYGQKEHSVFLKLNLFTKVNGKNVPFEEMGKLTIYKKNKSTVKEAQIPINGKVEVILPKKGVWYIEKKNKFNKYVGQLKVTFDTETSNITKEMILEVPHQPKMVEVNGKLITNLGNPVYPAIIYVLKKGRETSLYSVNSKKDGSFSVKLDEGSEYYLHFIGDLIKGRGGIKKEIPKDILKKNKWVVVVPEAKLNIVADVFYMNANGKEIPFEDYVRKVDQEIIKYQLIISKHFTNDKKETGYKRNLNFPFMKDNKVYIYDLEHTFYSLKGVEILKAVSEHGKRRRIRKMYPVVKAPINFWIKKDTPLKRMKIVVGLEKLVLMTAQIIDRETKENINNGVLLARHLSQSSKNYSFKSNEDGIINGKMCAGKYAVQIIASGYKKAAQVTEIKSNTRLKYELEKKTSILGRVTSEKGPIKRASIILVSGNMNELSAHTDENGNFKLIGLDEDKTYILTVQKKGFAPLFKTWSYNKKSELRILLKVDKRNLIHGILQFEGKKILKSGILVFSPKKIRNRVIGVRCLLQKEGTFSAKLSEGDYSVTLIDISSRENKKFYILADAQVNDKDNIIKLHCKAPKPYSLEDLLGE